MNLVDLTINGTAISSPDDNHSLVILKEKDGERIIPVQTSARCATQLMVRRMLSMPVPVPLTIADTMHLMFSKMDIKMKRVQVAMVTAGQFFANIVAEKDGEEFTVEMCPMQEGLVIATTFGCRICIEDELLEAQYMRKVGEDAYVMNMESVSQKMLEDALKRAVETENYEVAGKLKKELDKRKGIHE